MPPAFIGDQGGPDGQGDKKREPDIGREEMGKLNCEWGYGIRGRPQQSNPLTEEPGREQEDKQDGEGIDNRGDFAPEHGDVVEIGVRIARNPLEDMPDSVDNDDRQRAVCIVAVIGVVVTGFGARIER